jgi:hypothetical protein
MGRHSAVIALCLNLKCAWRTVELGDDFLLGHHLSFAHTIMCHREKYPRVSWHDSVPVLSPSAVIQLSFYTDFSRESVL